MLKHSGKRASALLLSLAVAAAAFAVPAFATDALPMASQPETVSAPVESLPQDPSSAVQSQPETVSQPEVLPSEPEGTVSGGIEPTPDDPSSGTEGTSSGMEGTGSGEPVSEPEAPVSEPEAPVSEPEAPSSSVQQQPVASRPAQTTRPSYTPDTDQDEIDRLASQAAAGNNDAEEPLSSQDWSALLNQSEEPEEDPNSSMGAVSGEESGGASASSAAVQNSTRSSWLLPVGIVLILLLDILLRRTRYGYYLRSVGGNQDASIMAGINAKRVKIIAFVLAGVFAAVGGMFDVLNAGASNSVFGNGREFRAIICCAIGGISMSGGAGSSFGVALGVLLFHTLWYCLRILDVNTNLQLVLIGLILVLSVIMDVQRKRLEARKMV